MPDFSGPSFFSSPYSAYASIRAAGKPVWEPNSRAWLIARYTDVEALLRDPRLSKNFRRESPTPFDMSVLFQDPPGHTRARGILNQAFSGPALQGLDARIRQIADGLIDRMQAGNSTDFISAYAAPLPVAVISGLLGIPPGPAEKLHRLSGAFIVEDSLTPQQAQLRQYESICSMAGYFRELIAGRATEPRAQPDDDVLSAMMRANAESDDLTPDELVGNCILLMVAGHETTVNLLGNGMYLLLRHPEQLERLKQQPELWPSAIEEMLRFESPVQMGTFRVTTEPMQIAGVAVDSGSAVTAVIGSANRDPNQFPDPDRFDIARTPNRHLAFGMGPHRCLGASLARMEARIGFARLFERLPNLAFASSSGWLPWTRRTCQPKWRSNAITRGLTELRLSWPKSAGSKLRPAAVQQ